MPPGGSVIEEGGPSGPVSYAALLRQPKAPTKTVSIKPILYLHGEPQVI